MSPKNKMTMSSRMLYYWGSAFGVDLRRLATAGPGLLRFIRTYLIVLRQRRRLRLSRAWPLKPDYPQIHDYKDVSGSMRGHYFHQDLWVAQQIYKRHPEKHLDVGSRIDGFVAHLASFRTVDLLDIRPNISHVDAIRYIRADITKTIPGIQEAYASVSCLHALEHFGLGRYGDDVDLLGHEKGFVGLTRIVACGGILYLSVPIGAQRIEFNAHRVFAIREIERLYADSFDLIQFAYIDDGGDMHTPQGNQIPKDTDELWYGCGIFVLKKRSRRLT